LLSSIIETYGQRVCSKGREMQKLQNSAVDSVSVLFTLYNLIYMRGCDIVSGRKFSGATTK